MYIDRFVPEAIFVSRPPPAAGRSPAEARCSPTSAEKESEEQHEGRHGQEGEGIKASFNNVGTAGAGNSPIPVATHSAKECVTVSTFTDRFLLVKGNSKLGE